MQKETLDKLRRYIDLAAARASVTSPPGFRRDGGREQLWQEFVKAVQGDDYALGSLLNSIDQRMQALEDQE